MPGVSLFLTTLSKLNPFLKGKTDSDMPKNKKGKQNEKGPPEISMSSMDKHFTYKVLLLGSAKVGKTSILRTLCGEQFRTSYINTVGYDFVTKEFKVDAATVHLQIWDTSGQERFQTYTKRIYGGTKGIILVYDVADTKSFETVEPLLKHIEEVLDMESPEPIPVILVGNKTDLSEQRTVTSEEAHKVADRYFAYSHLETHSRDKEGITSLFQLMAQTLLEVYNPKVMTAYMTPQEKMIEYNSIVLSPVCNGHCACRGMPEAQEWKRKKRRRLRLKRKKLCCRCCIS